MLTRILSRLRRITPSNRPAPKAPARRLNLETLEAREVPATIYGLAANNMLIKFDSATPGTVSTPLAITGLQTGQTLQGIDFRPRTGQLFGSAVPTASTTNSIITTYSINPLTGVATLVGATTAALAGAGNVNTGYDFNPSVDRIRYVNELNENARLNPNNGLLAGNDTDLTFTAPATGPIVGAAYDRNTDRANATTIPTTLYLIDGGSSRLVVQGGINGATPPGPNGGVVTNIGSLGVTLTTNSEAGFDIAASTANGGLGTAFAALTTGTGAGTTGLYTINLTTGAATLVGNIGNGATELFSIAVAPANVVVVGSGAGAMGDVRILDSATGALQRAVSNPFPGFLGGVRVASGDVTGDGIPDAIISAVSLGAQGHVKVFDGASGAEVRSFFTFVGFQGTVNVGAGDVNGDGIADILVSADGVSGGHVKAFNGSLAALSSGGVPVELASFFAYPGFLGNVTVAGADLDNNGIDEIVTAATNNGHVKVFGVAVTGAATPFTTGPVPVISSFFAFQGFTAGPVNVAAGDVNGDGFADLVVAAGAGAAAGHVKAINGQTGLDIVSFFSLPSDFTGGASVALADVNNDGRLDIRVTPGAGLPAQVFAFDGLTAASLGMFDTFATFQGGSTVAGARF